MVNDDLEILEVKRVPLVPLEVWITHHSGAADDRIGLARRPTDEHPLLLAPQLPADDAVHFSMRVRSEGDLKRALFRLFRQILLI